MGVGRFKFGTFTPAIVNPKLFEAGRFPRFSEIDHVPSGILIFNKGTVDQL